MVLMYMVDVHGCCAWLEHGMEHDVHDCFIVDISFSSWLMHEIVCMIGIHLMYGVARFYMVDAWIGPRIITKRENNS